ncbi:class E sortase [Streptomyces sp. NBC_00690]|nr:class E sortase [Streptomyces sp. NBC_00690]
MRRHRGGRPFGRARASGGQGPGVTARRPGDEYDPLADPEPPVEPWPRGRPVHGSQPPGRAEYGHPGEPSPGARAYTENYQQGWSDRPQPPTRPAGPGGRPGPADGRAGTGLPGSAPAGGPRPRGGRAPQGHRPVGPMDATTAFPRTPGARPVSSAEPVTAPMPVIDFNGPGGARPGTAAPGAERPPGPGRAERRRAAKSRGRKRAAPPPGAPAASASASGPPGRPMTRVEARRAAREAKDSPAVIASRAIGELFITFGVLMLLFVTYQLWWTNIRAGQEVDRETSKIQDAWAEGRKPDAFQPGQGFAIMHIPKLDVVVPVAAGIDKEKVLDRGMVGHYNEGGLKTALPSARTGNFAVAGHRNTHGEPFRYVNRLKPGDPIVVETQDAYYTYEMASILPQTPPSNVSVIGPVPPGSGFSGPGRYITLTTCTPEFTSTFRMIVWGKMVEERPRSKGKPDALVG